jgi:hypothetical protein
VVFTYLEINNRSLFGPRVQTLYQAINDFGARVNHLNDYWQRDKNPLKNYSLPEIELWRWQERWQEELNNNQ